MCHQSGGKEALSNDNVCLLPWHYLAQATTASIIGITGLYINGWLVTDMHVDSDLQALFLWMTVFTSFVPKHYRSRCTSLLLGTGTYGLNHRDNTLVITDTWLTEPQLSAAAIMHPTLYATVVIEIQLPAMTIISAYSSDLCDSIRRFFSHWNHLPWHDNAPSCTSVTLFTVILVIQQ